MGGLPDNARTAFDNSPHLKVVYWPFVRANGEAGIQSRVFLRNGATAIALDVKTHEVYVVRQTRETPEGSITTIELPGGGVDSGDTPLDTARKELLEEAGVVALNEQDWVPLYREDGVHPIDGLAFTSQHAFLLLAGRKVQDPSGEENTEVTTVPLSELIAMDNRNEFNDPLGPYAMRRAQDWLREHRPDLLT
ncbi:MAG: hypothetical protein A2126_00940 [Candidatus Woykebacteria bacterium GWB1_45_5]|uniref:NUDIX hydrolase n=2 Tax=Microgenomates group TaxID=1794810 RepID=A0A0G1MUZ3_9BACT|nr:MAG: NUDIX hydrolase [Candidatus Woesebacteria bacterium GW2011_GWA1_45_8]OGY23976.1 MAG: hypothetical protein A2126_00940 [Candidatus Woykebacteria bacterium GWB1_45_5]